MSYTDFIAQNVAPYSADHIGVYDSSGNKVGKINLGSFKPTYGTRLYRFGLLSDTHNQTTQTDYNQTDLEHALEYFNTNQSVGLTIVAGDISQSGTAAEFSMWKDIVNDKSPNTPVYTTVGNHDATTSGLDVTNWQTYTGYAQTFEITRGTDHFLFMGMNIYNANAPFRTVDRTWLKQHLEKYRNERCFVIIHMYAQDYAGDCQNCYNKGLKATTEQGLEIKNLILHYSNSIWISGHSHIKWEYQKWDEKLNIYRPSSTSGWTVHIPSCANPANIVDDGDGTYSMGTYDGAGSQGAIADVYANYVDIRGMDLKNTKYLPIAQFRLDTTIQTVARDTSIAIPYSVINNLTNVTTSNTATEVDSGSSYTATLSGTSSYAVGTVTVTMGGTDISSTAVSGSVISISSVTGDIVITASGISLPTYTVTNNLTHCTSSSSVSSVIQGGSYTTSLTASSGYVLSTATVTMGGTNITSSAYNSSSHAISISNVTGNIVITATASALPTYSVTISGSVTSSNSNTSVVENGSYSTTLSTASGVGITTVTVTMGGTNITSSAYTSSTKTVSISNVTGNIVITVATEAVLPDGYTRITASMFQKYGSMTLPTIKQVDERTITVTFSTSGKSIIVMPGITKDPYLYVGSVTYSGALTGPNVGVGIIKLDGNYQIATANPGTYQYTGSTPNGFQFGISNSKYGTGTGKYPFTITIKDIGFKAAD